MFIILVIFFSYTPIFANEATQAVIWTDKQDYSPGETVTIFGEGFLANVDVTVAIERPDGTIDEVYALTDDFGSFTCTYQLDGIAGTYTVTATDGTNTAATTFTDAKPTFSITIDTIDGYSFPYPTLTNPTHLAGHASSTNFPGQLSGYQVQVDWGDGTVDMNSIVNFVQSGNDFSGTWSSDPDHNYATGGTYTITVKLYHQQSPGGESAEAQAQATIQVAPSTASIVVTTSPSGLSIFVDNVTYIAPQTFNWVVGSTHSIGTTSPQSGGTGIQYVWTGWSDLGAITHTMTTPSTSTTYTANFKTQYYLTVTSAYDSPTGQGWYDSGSTAYATVTPLTVSGPAGVQYVFTQWTGDASGATSPSNPITMDGPKTATVNWKTQYYLTTSTNYGSVSPGSGWHDAGTVLTISATPPSVVDGEQYVWLGWTGIGAISYNGMDNPAIDSVTMNGPITETAAWRHEYYLTVNTNPPEVLSLNSASICGKGWYEAETTANVDAVQLVDEVAGASRYDFRSWTGASPTGVGNKATVYMDSPKTATANYQLQYKIIFDQSVVGSDFGGTVVTIDTIDNYGVSQLLTSFWWDDQSTHSFAFQSPLVVTTNVKQYVWDTTSGLSSAQSDNSFQVTESGSITGNYKTQYYMTFAQTGVDTDFTGTVMTVGGTDCDRFGHSDWYDSGASITFSFNSPLNVDSGKRYVLTGQSATSPLSVSTSATVTATYHTEYYLTVNSVHDTPTGEDWYDAASTPTISMTDTTVPSGSGTQYVFTGWSSIDSGGYTGTDVSHSVTMNGPIMETASWKAQYKQMFGSSGLGVDATGNLVTFSVTGGSYSGATSPIGVAGGHIWVDADATVNYAFVNPVTSSVTGKQYRLDSVSGPASGCTVSGANTLTGSYVIQWQVTFDQTGLDSSASGTVVTMSGNPKTYTDLPLTDWFDSGTTYSYTDPVSSTVADKQFRLDSVTGPASFITSSGTVTGNYMPQYKVTFTQFGLDGTATDTIVTVAGEAKTLSDLPFTTDWLDQGTSLTFAHSDPVTSSVSGKQFRLDGVNDTPPLSVTAPTTITGTYVTQYRLIVSSDHDAPDLFVGEHWYDASTHIDALVTSPADESDGTRYRCTGYTGTGSVGSGSGSSVGFDITVPSTLIWNWIEQYQVAFDQTGVGSDFTGTVIIIDGTNYDSNGASFWWDDSSSHTFAYASPLTVTTNVKQYVLTSVDASSPYTVSGSATVTGAYHTEYYVTFSATGLDSYADTNTVLTLGGVDYIWNNLPSNVWVDDGTAFTWESTVSGGAGKQFVKTGQSGLSSPVTTSGTSTATYTTQFQVPASYSTSDGSTPLANVVLSGTQSGDSAFTVTLTTTVQYVWLDADTAWSVNNPIVVSGTERWDAASGTSGTVSSSTTIAPEYYHQYKVTLSYSTSDGSPPSSDPTFTANQLGSSVDQVLTTAPTGYWFDAGSLWSVTDPIPPSPGSERWKLNQATSGTVSATTINFVCYHQFLLTVTASPSGALGGDFEVTYIQCETTHTDESHTTLWTGWVDTGTLQDVELEALDVAGYTFDYWDVDTTTVSGNPITVHMDASHTATAYCSQIVPPAGEIVTFYEDGIGIDFTGTVLTVDEVNYKVTDLPVSFKWTFYSEHTFTYHSPLNVGTDKRYVWTSTSGLSSVQSGTITVPDGEGSITGYYKIQYYLTINNGGHETATGEGWYDAGSNAIFSISPKTVSGSAGTRYVFTGWIGSGTGSYTGSDTSNSVTMNDPITETARWRTQYYLTVTSAHDTPGGAGWYNSGTTARATLANGIVSGGSGTQYVFTGWSSDASGTGLTSNSIIMNGPKTAKANWKTQYYLTVHSFYDFPTGKGWYDSGSTASSSVTSPVSGGAGIQYVATGFVGTGSAPSGGSGTSVSFTINSPSSITWNWKTQYYLTLTTNPSGVNSPSGEGWYDTGAYAPISTEEYVNNPGSSRYRFNGWTGEIAETSSTSTTVLMNEAKIVKANYEIQYEVTFYQSGVGQDFLGTVVKIAGNNYGQSASSNGVELWIDSSSSVSFTYYTPLTASSEKSYVLLSVDKSSPLIVTAPTTVTATYSYHVDPTVILTLNPQSGVAGSTLTYTLSITNNDDPSFGSSEFSLTYFVPPGWAASLSNTSVIIAPGSTDSSVTLSVASSSLASIGDYIISVAVTNTGAMSYQGIGSAAYSIVSAVPAFEFASIAAVLFTSATVGISKAIGKGFLSRLEADFETEREVDIKRLIRRRREIIFLTAGILIVGSALFYDHAEIIHETSSHVEFGGYQEMALLFFELAFLVSIVSVTSYVARLIFARHLGAKTEYRLWIFGVLSLFITTLIFKAPVGAPSKVNVTKDTPHDVRGKLSLLVTSVVIATSGILYILLVLGYPTEAGVYYGLTLAACSSIPVKPLAGHDIYHYNKILSIVLVIVCYTLFFLYLF